MKLLPITETPKQPQVVKALEQLARALGPGARMPRVREAAQALGVTVATLGESLRQLEIRGLIERRPRSGIFVASGIRQKSIGLVFGRNIFHGGVSPFYRQLIDHCQKRAVAHGERFSFYLDIDGMPGGESPLHRDLESAIKDSKLDGIILSCRGVLSQEVWLRSKGIPLVVIGDTDLGPGFVTWNRQSFTRLGLQSLGTDCRSVGIVGVQHPDVNVFESLLDEFGLETRADWIIRPQGQYNPGAEGHEKYGYAGMQAILSAGHPLPGGLIVTDDTATRGVCLALQEAGLEPGRDIQIATHANKGSAYLAEWSSALRLIEVDPTEMVEAVFGVLEDLMSEKPIGNAFRIIEPQLPNP